MKSAESIKSSVSQTYLCWLGISCKIPNLELPPGITKEHLNEYLVKHSKDQGNFYNLNLKFNPKNKRYQCFIKFFSEESAKKAVGFFNKSDLDNISIEAQYKGAEDTKKENHSEMNPLLAQKTKLKEDKKQNLPSKNDKLRYVVIDGNNVAINHGKEMVFSSQGIQLVVDYFKNRGHTEIKAFVPQFRKNNFKNPHPTKDPNILENLHKQGYVVFTPSISYDDGFILETAKLKDAIIVSNDRYNDLIFEEKYAEQKKNLVPFSIFDDVFLPSNDPYGKKGPSLDELLIKKQPQIKSSLISETHTPVKDNKSTNNLEAKSKNSKCKIKQKKVCLMKIMFLKMMKITNYLGKHRN